MNHVCCLDLWHLAREHFETLRDASVSYVRTPTEYRVRNRRSSHTLPEREESGVSWYCSQPFSSAPPVILLFFLLFTKYL